MKMVDKSRISEAYSFVQLSFLTVSLKSTCMQIRGNINDFSSDLISSSLILGFRDQTLNIYRQCEDRKDLNEKNRIA